MAKWEIDLNCTVYRSATVVIDADTEEEARELAEAGEYDDTAYTQEWIDYDGELTDVVRITPYIPEYTKTENESTIHNRND